MKSARDLVSAILWFLGGTLSRQEASNRLFLFKMDERQRPVKVSPTDFVLYWKDQYEEMKYPTEKLERNLNVGGLLGSHNVRELLEWKLAFLPNQEREELVTKLAPKVCEKLPQFNDFRQLDRVLNGEFEKFWNMCQELTKSVGRGFVIGAYLVFIARPLGYPMADQHVFRAYHFVKYGVVADPLNNLETYMAYRKFFYDFYGVSHNDLRDVDKALWSFGKRLKRLRFQPWLQEASSFAGQW